MKKSAPLQWAYSEIERSFFDGEVQSLVVACAASERPPQGLAGLLDWRLGGALSQGLRAGAFSGASGEIAYLPVRKGDRVYHLLLAGIGPVDEPGQREGLPADTLRKLQKNLATLKFRSVGASKADLFGQGQGAAEAQKQVKGITRWLNP